MRDLRHLAREQRADPLAREAVRVRRPKTRGECRDGERPCPFTSCRFHLALDVADCGSLQVNWPGTELGELLDLDEIPETCALDVAERYPATLEEVGALLNLTRERVRQIEARALRKVRRRVVGMDLGREDS